MMNSDTRAGEAERVLNLTYPPRLLVLEKIQVNPKGFSLRTYSGSLFSENPNWVGLGLRRPLPKTSIKLVNRKDYFSSWAED